MGGGWGLLMMPGLFLTVMAIAILIWPELLAYMVAGVLLFAGVSLMLWAWSMRRLEESANHSTQVRYRIY
jgi:membrane protein implicated in regulation of membrane protease activity